MAPASQNTPTRSAIYAQERRDNETEARRLLLEQLSGACKTSIPSEIETRGDLNATSKALATALLYIDQEAQIPVRVDRKSYGNNSAEYNQIRRSNEVKVREALRSKIPRHILRKDFWKQSSLNQTTKVILAAAKYLDEINVKAAARISTDQAGFHFPCMYAVLTLGQIEVPVRQISPWPLSVSTTTDIGMSPPPLKRKRSEIPDSDDDSSSLQRPSSSRTATAENPTPSSIFVAVNQRNEDCLLDYLPSECEMTMSLPSTKSKSEEPVLAPENNYTAKPWEEQQTEPHPVAEMQYLEQVAKRLVAKAKMMLEPPEEPKRCSRGYSVRPEMVTDQDKDELEFIGDLLTDMITMIEIGEEKKRIKKKWEAQQKRWAKEGVAEE